MWIGVPRIVVRVIATLLLTVARGVVCLLVMTGVVSVTTRRSGRCGDGLGTERIEQVFRDSPLSLSTTTIPFVTSRS
jgi:hypothetical protein